MHTPLSFVHRFEPGSSEATLLVLHGTGGDENDLIGLARELAPTAPLLSPRGKVLENGAPRFFRRLAPGVFDLEDLRTQAADLARFVQGAAQQYGLDRDQIYALGYSNGGNMAAALLLLYPEILAGGVLLRAMMPLEPQPLPHLKGRSVFLAAGRQDPLIPPGSVETLAQRLRQAGADLELRWQPGGHSLYPAELEAARRWLEAHL